jgi:putative acetyltransferase
MDIVCVNSPQEINEIRGLFREYEAFFDVDLWFQQFESEQASIPGKYAPPDGMLLLARNGQEVFGCGARRRFGSIQKRTCEMKRLYVRPKARGLGIGRDLAGRLIREGLRLCYSTMVLDTLDRLKAAMCLYQSLGFMLTEPYYDNPLSGVVYWKLDLNSIHPTGHRCGAARF